MSTECQAHPGVELMLAVGVHGADVEAIRNVVEAGRYEH